MKHLARRKVSDVDQTENWAESCSYEDHRAEPSRWRLQEVRVHDWDRCRTRSNPDNQRKDQVASLLAHQSVVERRNWTPRNHHSDSHIIYPEQEISCICTLAAACMVVGTESEHQDGTGSVDVERPSRNIWQNLIIFKLVQLLSVWDHVA